VIVVGPMEKAFATGAPAESVDSSILVDANVSIA
jgi:hypothetical protein